MAAAPAELPITCPECGQGLSAEICAYCGAHVVPEVLVLPSGMTGQRPAQASPARGAPQPSVPRPPSWAGWAAVTVAALAPALGLALMVAVLVTEVLQLLKAVPLPPLTAQLVKAGSAGFAGGLCIGMAHRVFRQRGRSWLAAWAVALGALAVGTTFYFSAHPLAVESPWDELRALARLLSS